MGVRWIVFVCCAVLPLLVGATAPAGPRPMRPLEGVNLSGGETSCVSGPALPADAARLAGALRSWPISAVRLPLNEDCWLGINGVASGGQRYREAIAGLVRDLERDYTVIIDLQWSAPGTIPATAVQPMPDADHSPAFWSGVASWFRADPRVQYDLFNEPDPDSWECWRSGCEQHYYYGRENYWYRWPATWRSAGMATLVAAVRRAGAWQPILLGGIGRANDLSQWSRFRPRDPNLVAAWHAYPGLPCNRVECWDATVAPLAKRGRVIASEVGEADETCSAHYVTELLGWLEAHHVGYLAWSFNPWRSCSYALIADVSGRPSPGYGQWVFDHLSADAARRLPASDG